MALRKKTPTGKVASPGYPPAFRSLVEEAATAYHHPQVLRGALRRGEGGHSDLHRVRHVPLQRERGREGLEPPPGRPRDRHPVAAGAHRQPGGSRQGGRASTDRQDEGRGLAEVISQVNKEALAKLVDAATLQALVVKTAEGELPLQVSVRVDNTYKAEIASKLSANFPGSSPRSSSGGAATPRSRPASEPETNAAMNKLRGRSSRKAAIQA